MHNLCPQPQSSDGDLYEDRTAAGRRTLRWLRPSMPPEILYTRPPLTKMVYGLETVMSPHSIIMARGYVRNTMYGREHRTETKLKTYLYTKI